MMTLSFAPIFFRTLRPAGRPIRHGDHRAVLRIDSQAKTLSSFHGSQGCISILRAGGTVNVYASMTSGELLWTAKALPSESRTLPTAAGGRGHLPVIPAAGVWPEYRPREVKLGTRWANGREEHAYAEEHAYEST